jgi:hypothetical protein
MEPKGSLQSSQEQINRPYLELHEFSPNPYNINFIKSNLILSSYLCLPFRFSNQNHYAFLICPTFATCPAHISYLIWPPLVKFTAELKIVAVCEMLQNQMLTFTCHILHCTFCSIQLNNSWCNKKCIELVVKSLGRQSFGKTLRGWKSNDEIELRETDFENVN